MVERRYTVMERSTATQNEVVDCAGRVGAEVLGLQAELDKSDCTNKVSGGHQCPSIALSSQNLTSNVINSTTVERMIVSTYGR